MALADRLKRDGPPGEVAVIAEEAPKVVSRYGALTIPIYRRYFIAAFGSNVGSWMQIVGQGWLVLQLTDSAFYLGLMGLVRAIPTIGFSLVGGVIADRFDRRYVLVVTQSAAMVSAFLLAALTWAGVITVWDILAITFVSAIFFAVDNPTRQALIPDLVGRRHITSAIGINSAAWNGAAIIGPSVGGVLLALFSAAGLFFLNGISYVGMVAVVLTIPPLPERDRPLRSVVDQLSEGLGYVRSRSVVWGLLLLIAIPAVLARPYTQLMPYFARDVLGQGASGYGLLMAASGIGALAGALVTATLKENSRRGVLVLAVTAVLGGFLLLFAASRWFWLSMAFVTVVGAASTLMMSVTNSLLQGIVSNEMRGRVMSVYTLIAGGLMPLGSMVLGSSGELFGVPLVVAIGGAITFGAALGFARLMPEVRRLG